MFNFNIAYVTSSNYTAGPGDVVLSGDPTTAGASNNFALNSTAGGGAACAGAGFPAYFRWAELATLPLVRLIRRFPPPPPSS